MSAERVASWYHREDGLVRCDLCPHRCALSEGGTGRCGARTVRDGRLFASSYGKVCVHNLDPVEKKPLYHYRPGTLVYSIGTYGCNLDCANCQNFELAGSREGGLAAVPMTAPEVVREAADAGAQGIAFTFNEPVTWYEFVMDVAAEARRRGLYTVLNTNGYVLPGPADQLFGRVDAANIDVKGFTEPFYRTICKASLSEVLDTCVRAREGGAHVELTYLLIPGLNDSADEISRFARWSVERMGPDTPLIFFRFRPFHRLSHLPEQSMEKMVEAYDIAKREGARFVYFGGVAGDPHVNTYCPRCGRLVVERSAVRASDKVCFKGQEVSRFCPTVAEVRADLAEGRCPRCGESIPIALGAIER